jgi:hypothetical protein
MNADQIVSAAIHDVKYPDGSWPGFPDDAKWPKHSDTISGDPIITESDLEELLPKIVDRIFDEVFERIAEMRFR